MGQIALWMTETSDLHSTPIPLASCVCVFVRGDLTLRDGFIYLISEHNKVLNDDIFFESYIINQ